MIEYILILDTEGLQSSERLDSEFDRKIVSFALCNSNIVICQCLKEFDKSMRDILQLCTISLSDLMKRQIPPEIYFSFGFNVEEDKGVFMKSISELE